MKFNKFQHYKHETIGKFNFISQIVSNMSDKSLSNGDENSNLTAIHNSFLNMVSISQDFMMSSIPLEVNLIIEKESRASVEVIKLNEIVVRVQVTESSLNYFYSTEENDSDLLFAIGIILPSLPVKRVTINETIGSIDYDRIISTIKKRNLL